MAFFEANKATFLEGENPTLNWGNITRLLVPIKKFNPVVILQVPILDFQILRLKETKFY